MEPTKSTLDLSPPTELSDATLIHWLRGFVDMWGNARDQQHANALLKRFIHAQAKRPPIE